MSIAKRRISTRVTSRPQRFFGAEAPQNDNKSNPQDKITLQGNLVCHSERYGESLHKATRQSLSYCHSERSEESLKESLVAKRDSSPSARVQNDNKSNPQDKITLQGKLFCHSEGARSATEESLLSTKDSLNESLERQLLCHSKHCEESLSNLLESQQRFFGAEAPQNDNSGRVSSDSCRDSSPLAGVQNDKITAFTRKPKSPQKFPPFVLYAS